MSRQYIGIEEANGMLPALRQSFQLLFQLHLHVKTLIEELEYAGFAPHSDTFPIYVKDAPEEVVLARGQLRAVIDLMGDELDLLRKCGCIIRDIEDGGVSWYAKHPARGEILLSWRIGEPEVSFWLDTNAAEPTRRSLQELDEVDEVRLPNTGGIDRNS